MDELVKRRLPEFRARNKDMIIHYQNTMIDHFRRSGARNPKSAYDTWQTSDTADLAVVRYDQHGRLDRAFGHDGVATADFGGRDDRLRGLVRQPDGKIVAVGSSETDFALARFEAPPAR